MGAIRVKFILKFCLVWVLVERVTFAEPLPALTTMSDPLIRYSVPDLPYCTLTRGDITAVIVNNQSVDDEVLGEHREGYSGVAKLTHQSAPENLFVPNYAGLNFEHIHDGSVRTRDVLYEPRRSPMELRVIDAQTCELYQPPTPHWKLESCTRYHLLEDGALEMTFEAIPHEATFTNGYIGLFWASYIQHPSSKNIHFKGHRVGETSEKTRWIEGVTPGHGSLATHLSAGDQRKLDHAEDFPLELVFSRSDYLIDEPWYFGVNGNMALVMMFRPEDQIRMTQSPSGGGGENPAWDFQFFVRPYEVGQRYQMVMRALYTPYVSHDQIEVASRPHRDALRTRPDDRPGNQ